MADKFNIPQPYYKEFNKPIDFNTNPSEFYKLNFGPQPPVLDKNTYINNKLNSYYGDGWNWSTFRHDDIFVVSEIDQATDLDHATLIKFQESLNDDYEELDKIFFDGNEKEWDEKSEDIIKRIENMHRYIENALLSKEKFKCIKNHLISRFTVHRKMIALFNNFYSNNK